MALAVGVQRVSGLRDRGLDPDCAERVLQRTPLSRVHVHVARGDDRQTSGFGDGGELLTARRIVGLEQAFGSDPERTGKTRR